MLRIFFFTFLALSALVLLINSGKASAYERPEQKPAIILAAFGTSDPEALKSIFNVEEKIKKAFPGYDVHLAFTSNIIRNKWKKTLAADNKFREENKDIPARMYEIKNPLSVLAELQEQGGAGKVLVQSLHITNGSEYADLKSIIDNLAKITALQESLKPFAKLLISDSALSEGTQRDIDQAVKALEPLAAAAKKENATLVLMGHGNEHLPLAVYAQLEKALSEAHKLAVIICLVEGKPDFEDALASLKKSGAKTAYLSPLMLVAGDHAKNDMASDEDDSLASILNKNGIKAIINLQGLGSLDAWADIYVQKLKNLESK